MRSWRGAVGQTSHRLHLGNYQSLAAAKPEFGSCQTRVWPLPNPSLVAANQSLAAAKPEFSCQTIVQLPNPSLAAAKPECGSCQTWQLPNGPQNLSCGARVWQLWHTAKPGFGSCQTRASQHLFIYIYKYIYTDMNLIIFGRCPMTLYYIKKQSSSGSLALGSPAAASWLSGAMCTGATHCTLHQPGA